MTKIDFVKMMLFKLEVPEITPTRYCKSILLLACEGRKAAGISSSGQTKIHKKYFPNKPRGVTLLNYLASIVDKKYCPRCDLVLDKEEFSNNTSRKDGKQGYCKICVKDRKSIEYKENPGSYKARAMAYKSAKLQRTPAWADIEKIKEIYVYCPEGYHVDHIIPLRGDTVSGLHTELNLQYLKAEDNLKKSNKYENKKHL